MGSSASSSLQPDRQHIQVPWQWYHSEEHTRDTDVAEWPFITVTLLFTVAGEGGQEKIIQN
jgi:hypothetical protein